MSLKTWEHLEDTIRDRFDSAVSSLQRTKPGTRLQGKTSPGSSLCRVLEEVKSRKYLKLLADNYFQVTALWSWDRPALFSPIKSAKKTELRFGNSVFVFTKLPVNMDQLNHFINNDSDRRVAPKARELVESFTSKRIKATLTGELNISLHILNTVDQDFDPDIVQVEIFHL